jgi:hypothetical protein
MRLEMGANGLNNSRGGTEIGMPINMPRNGTGMREVPIFSRAVSVTSYLYFSSVISPNKVDIISINFFATKGS